jgi:hypothetical protein
MLQEHIACADCLEVDCLIADFAFSIAEVFHECFLTLLPSGKKLYSTGKSCLDAGAALRLDHDYGRMSVRITVHLAIAMPWC